MRGTAESIEEFLAALDPDRRADVERVRRTILDHLPEGFEEGFNWGMITYQVPLERYPDTYNGQPLMVAALAAQKRHLSLYLIGIYADEEARDRFEEAYRATGKRYDVGKSCVRFRTLDDLPLDLVGESIASMTVEGFIEKTEAARQRGGRKKA